MNKNFFIIATMLTIHAAMQCSQVTPPAEDESANPYSYRRRIDPRTNRGLTEAQTIAPVTTAAIIAPTPQRPDQIPTLNPRSSFLRGNQTTETATGNNRRTNQFQEARQQEARLRAERQEQDHLKLIDALRTTMTVNNQGREGQPIKFFDCIDGLPNFNAQRHPGANEYLTNQQRLQQAHENMRRTDAKLIQATTLFEKRIDEINRVFRLNRPHPEFQAHAKNAIEYTHEEYATACQKYTDAIYDLDAQRKQLYARHPQQINRNLYPANTIMGGMLEDLEPTTPRTPTSPALTNPSTSSNSPLQVGPASPTILDAARPSPQTDDQGRSAAATPYILSPTRP